ncbi:MAG: hypothetical protein U0X40_04370 [Ferruginibacter sp.]
MPEAATQPPFTIDLEKARNYISAFRTGMTQEGGKHIPISPAQQQSALLDKYWAPANPLKTGEEYDYSNAPSCLTMKAFTFALRDITDLLNRIRVYNGFEPIPNIEPVRQQDPITGIRFYIGMKPNPAFDPAFPVKPPYIPCLVFLPVTNFVGGRMEEGIYIASKPGEDLVSLPVLVTEPVNGATMDIPLEEGSALYDFSFPCPDTCAPVDL